MNIHLPAILMFTRGTRFWPIPIWEWKAWRPLNPASHSPPGRSQCQGKSKKWHWRRPLRGANQRGTSRWRVEAWGQKDGKAMKAPSEQIKIRVIHSDSLGFTWCSDDLMDIFGFAQEVPVAFTVDRISVISNMGRPAFCSPGFCEDRRWHCRRVGWDRCDPIGIQWKLPSMNASVYFGTFSSGFPQFNLDVSFSKGKI